MEAPCGTWLWMDYNCLRIQCIFVSLLISQLINDRFYYFTLYYDVFMLCSMLRCLQPAPQGSRLRSGSTRPSGAAAAPRRRAREAHRGAVRSVRRRRGSAPPCNSGADCRSQAPPRWHKTKALGKTEKEDSNIEHRTSNIEHRSAFKVESWKMYFFHACDDW